MDVGRAKRIETSPCSPGSCVAGEIDPLEGHVHIMWSPFGKRGKGHLVQSRTSRKPLRKIPELNLEGLARVSLGKQGRKGRGNATKPETVQRVNS